MATLGFTLTELLIVLVIAAILTLAGMPAFNEQLHYQQARTYTRQLSQHLSFARAHAIASQQTVVICPVSAGSCQSNWQHYPVQVNRVVPATNHQELLRELPPLPQQHRLIYNREQLSFRRDGSLNALENGTFLYCPPLQYQWHYQIVINQAGRSRLLQATGNCPG